MDPNTYTDQNPTLDERTNDQYSLGSLISRTSNTRLPRTGGTVNSLGPAISSQQRFQSPQNRDNGSLTVTHTIEPPENSERASSEGVLLVRGDSSLTLNSDNTSSAAGPEKNSEQHQPSVRWAEDTVDNENMNKKKSKICCIYRKPWTWTDPPADSDPDSSDCSDCEGHHHNEPNSYERND
ncbi:hypothetical protein BB560_001236 [Smittium megazygosporum]|uniref:Type 1 phosphatases regulator n=1 Tax=Smittium megazygosporum TaxID=133381 RepID=A0A2T9ZID8_9FUNG|nr:hypothetical protein BB560_001236 [Smittium megazygosporum]